MISSLIQKTRLLSSNRKLLFSSANAFNNAFRMQLPLQRQFSSASIDNDLKVRSAVILSLDRQKLA
jgi:hypothetical protein